MEPLFNRLLAKLKEELQPEDFKRWISPLGCHYPAEGQLTILAPNIFFKNWVTDNYLPLIKKALEDLSGRSIALDIIIGPGVKAASATPKTIEAGGREPRPASEDPSPWNSSLIRKYKFDNFVVGSSNQLAHAASWAAASRGASFNPLFIYGGSGLGKTHLLNAIGNYQTAQDESLKIIYLSSELFTNELIEALRTEGMTAFRQKYRKIDTLLIDDIHFIGGRERTQEEFFYTFNALYEADKQIVLSSDMMPKDIPDLEDRLRSRFEGGLFADISAPDQETKVAILERKAEEEGIKLSKEVGFYLASRKESNIRVLEGYLARLAAYSSLTKSPIDLPLAQKLLGLILEDEQKQINLDLIMKITSEHFNVKISDLKSSRKQQAVAVPRQAAMYLARQMTSMTTIEIGQRFGNRDHSTVIHAVKKVESKIAEDKSFAKALSDLEKAVKHGASQ